MGIKDPTQTIMQAANRALSLLENSAKSNNKGSLLNKLRDKIAPIGFHDYDPNKPPRENTIKWKGKNLEDGKPRFKPIHTGKYKGMWLDRLTKKYVKTATVQTRRRK